MKRINILVNILKFGVVIGMKYWVGDLHVVIQIKNLKNVWEKRVKDNPLPKNILSKDKLKKLQSHNKS